MNANKAEKVIKCTFSELINPNDLKPHPLNPNTHPPKQIDLLVKNINALGWRHPIIVSKRSGFVVAGHARMLAGRKMGAKVVPVDYQDFDGEDEERAYLIADNKISELSRIDNSILDGIMADFDSNKFDLELTGFADKELDKFINKDIKDIEKEKQDKEKNVSVVSLKDEASFPSAGRWNMPKIREDRIIRDCDDIRLWNKDNDSGYIMWNYGSDSTKGIDWKRTIVAYYVDDYRFECFWNDTAEKVQNLLDYGIYGAISPNYSVYYSYAGAVRIWNIYRSRWVARYMQEAGINIVPDISGAANDLDWVFDGLPKNCPIALQIHRESLSGASEKNSVIQGAIDTLNPSVIWVYGQKEKAIYYPALSKVECVWIVPRTSVKMIKLAKH